MIYINDHLRIKVLDDRNLQLEEYREGKSASGKKGALLGALSKQLFDSAQNEMTIKEVIAKIDEARAEILQAVGELKNG
ncbi:MAG: hypothetical protein IJV85_01215 [Clostridia bacterium]|nr:hypothetical protein [Clostridia bacterium]